MESLSETPIILGAGLAGLTAAQTLFAEGKPSLLLDKGRGVGGRVATRRIGELPANHGAPCFRLDRPDVVKAWQEALAQLAFAPAPSALDPRGYICAQGISSLPKVLAKGLTVRLETTVTEVTPLTEGYRITLQTGENLVTRQLLITAPLPQAAQFFKDSLPVLSQRLSTLAREVGYVPQWTGLVHWEGTLGPEIESSCLRLSEAEPIAMFHEQVPRKIWVLHASRTWTEAHLEQEASWVASFMKDELIRHFPEAKPCSIQAHRWRYARTERPLAQSYLTWPEWKGLAFAGDFCIESSIMGAAQSAWCWARDLRGKG